MLLLMRDGIVLTNFARRKRWPEAALRESRVRVMAAISNSGYQLP